MNSLHILAPVLLALGLGLYLFFNSLGVTSTSIHWIEIKMAFREAVMVFCTSETKQEILERKYERKKK